jgi:glycerol-3-phosphate dehydrogenase
VTHLADLLFRRTTIAISGQLTGAVLDETAAIAAGVLGWDSNRTRREIESSRDIALRRHGMVLRDPELAH